MSTSWFPNPEQWPVNHPDRLQLYTMATPNGQKVSIALEEMSLPYEWHLVNIINDDQHQPDYRKLSPNGKIPTIIDPDGPEGEPLIMMESGAILLYLAEKTGRFIPADQRGKLAVHQWLFFQMAHIGPMFGQFGHFFKFARDKTTDDYGVNRYTGEATRLLQVMDDRLAESDYLAGPEYTIADMATLPWVNCLDFYEGKPAVQYDRFRHVQRWCDELNARDAVRKGSQVGNLD